MLPTSSTGAASAAGAARSSQSKSMAATAPGAADSSTGMPESMPYRQIEYRLASTIPALKDAAAAYQVNAKLDEAAVRKLADTLGVKDPLTSQQGSWSAGPTFYVQPQGQWSYSSDAMTGQSGTASVSATCNPDGKCTSVEPPSTTTTTVPGLPPKAEAESIIRTQLEKAGSDLNGWTANAQDNGMGWSVTFTRKLDGHQVVGLDQGGTIGAHAKITNLYGTLATAEKLGDYPLVGTKVAFDRSKDQRFGIMRGAPADATPAGVAPAGVAQPADQGGTTLPPQIVEITGAEIVLQLAYAGCPGQAMYLVPAYRFRDASGNIALGDVPAVEDAYVNGGAAKDTKAPEGACGPETPQPQPQPAKVEPSPPVT